MQQSTVLFAALAGIATLVVLAFVLRPLWSRRGLTLAMIAVLALAAFGLYRMVGTPTALDLATQKIPETLQGAIAQLEQRLQQDPDQVEGWRLLGQAYASDQQAEKSRDAYARAAQLSPDDPDVLVEAAESRAIAASGRIFDDKAVAMLQHALQRQPQHQRARWFLGIAQRQSGEAAKAAATWEPLLGMVDATTAVPLHAQIDDARRDAGLPPLPEATAPANALQVKIRIDPKLAERIRLDGNATVFVIARAPNGPPMPVAVEKHSVSELPLTVSLDDGDGPMPMIKLSQLQEVEVLARLSKSGDAIPQPGDLSSAVVRVKLPANAPVELTISTGN